MFKARLNGATYPALASQMTQANLHRAGWRLAALLENVLGD
jgi:hypothetical protein